MNSSEAINRSALVTGAAGFIGFHLSRRLLEMGWDVVGIDNLNDYYDPSLKRARLEILEEYERFAFNRLDLADREGMEHLFDDTAFGVVVNLAAQAGVRYSIENPRAYIDSNIVGFLNILEGCRHSESVRHLVYASSSSVYGANTSYPFSVHDNVDHPVSLYAATKKSNELMAHTYSHLYGLPTTGLRFFTVYGPWGRPDMALFKFTRAIRAGEPIDVYGQGDMRRDFTYIDDIVEGVVRVMTNVPQPDPQWTGDAPDPSSSASPWRVFNIGNSDSVELLRFIEVIEDAIGKKGVKNLLPMQPGDVRATAADVKALSDAVGFKPSTPIEEGVRRFIDWYREYYSEV
ncbi:MAG: capsular biosynthesis protein CpsI [Acidobacteria bacterium]|nr:MAG: capsular biosynthesis protein CpsI [Acidobacteriota bacterium]